MKHLATYSGSNGLLQRSMVTTAALPATVITGMFGMNVGGLPFSESRAGFAVVVVVTLLLMAAAMNWLMRRGRQ